MIDHDNLDDFRDPETYDLECDSFAEDRPFMEEWARSIGGPLLDLACGTGRMAIHLALLGHEITGVDVVPEMIARARRKAAESAVSIEWVVADARSFRLDKEFPGIYMLMNAFQFLLTRADHEAMLARVREHLHPEGCFLFETRNPSPRNLFEVRNPEPQVYTTPDGGSLWLPNSNITTLSPRSSTTPPLTGGSTREVKRLRGYTGLPCATSFRRRWKPCSSTMGFGFSLVTETGGRNL